MPEDPVPAGVEGDGYATALYQALDQQEVTAGILMIAKEGVDHAAGGIVHCDQQRERRYPVPQPRVMAAVHLYRHALPRHTQAADPVLGRTLSPRTAQAGVDQDAPQGGPAGVDALSLAQQLAETGVVGPFVPGTSQANHSSCNGLGCCVGRPAAPVAVSNGGGSLLPVSRQEVPWYGVR